MLHMVEVFASWCGPSEAITSTFKKLYVAYQGRKVKFWQVNADTAPYLEKYAPSAALFLFFKDGAPPPPAAPPPPPPPLRAAPPPVAAAPRPPVAGRARVRRRAGGGGGGRERAGDHQAGRRPHPGGDGGHGRRRRGGRGRRGGGLMKNLQNVVENSARPVRRRRLHLALRVGRRASRSTPSQNRAWAAHRRESPPRATGGRRR